MDKKELFKELIEYLKKEYLNETEFLKCLEILNNLNEVELKREEKKFLVICGCDINILYLRFLIKNTPEDDYENLLHYRGNLIKYYKNKEKICKDQKQKMEIRKNYLEELKKHRDVLRIYKKDSSKKISVSKKLALTVKDIAKTMEIFMKEKDILKKVKRVLVDTAVGITGVSVIAAIGSIATMMWIGLPVTAGTVLSTVVSCAPTASYIGLSSLIRNFNNKTEFEQYLFKMSAEYQNLIKTFQLENKDEIKNIKQMKQDALLLRGLDKIKAHEEIIEKIKILISRTNIVEIKEGFELEIVGLLRENKDIREKIKDDYLEGIIQDKELYIQNNKELKKLNIKLFEKENSLKEAFKQAGVNFGTSFTVILMAKAILASVAPGTFAINGITDIGTPLLISAINCLLNIPTYHNKRKLQDSEYDERKFEEEKERIAQMLGIEKPAMKLA